MKLTKKLFISSLATISLVAPSISIASCAKQTQEAKIEFDYVTLSNKIKSTTLGEFIQIANIPRPSGECGKIYKYLKERITSLGFNPIDIGVGPDPTKYPMVNGPFKNIYFDIPATTGGSNFKPIILQGHMDMVRTGSGDHNNDPISIVHEIKDGQEIIHSKDYATSLGADNGIGIATMLSIATHYKEFSHGKIRCLITYDEETGLYGAEDVKKNAPEVFNGFDNLINIDAEVDCGIVYQSYGVTMSTIESTINVVDITQPHIYKLGFHGFVGGHSGEDIGFHRANAERIAYELLYTTINIDGRIATIIDCDHKNTAGVETGPKTNSIIPDFNIFVESNLDKTAFTETFKALRDKEKTGWKAKYTGENWNNITFSIDEDTSGTYTKSLGEDNSNRLVRLLGRDAMCGTHNMVDEEKHIPGSSGNIGPTHIEVNTGVSPAKAKVTTTLSTRSNLDSVVQDVGNTNPESVTSEFKAYNHYKIIKDNFEEAIPYEYKDHVIANGWHSTTKEEGNKLWKTLYDGYVDKAGKTPKEVSAYGGLECTTFHETKPSLNIISTGVRIEHCHSNDEVLYVESLVPETKALIYVLSNGDKL